MLNHLSLYVRNIEESRRFFSAALKPLGYEIFLAKEEKVGYGLKDVEGNSDFWIGQGEPHIESGISCIAFNAPNKEAVVAFYNAALVAGGKDNGAPGYRPKYHEGYYAAFVIDSNGYNIEAVFEDLEKLRVK